MRDRYFLRREFLLTFFFSIFFCSLGFAQLAEGFIDDLVISPIDDPTSGDPDDKETLMGTIFNDSGTQMFIWTKAGRLYVANWNGSNYVLQNTPFLDIAEEVGDWRDFGFMSLALDPDYDSNGLIYMYYIVDREHLINFGTPSYDPNDNDYFEATIGRLTRYQVNIGSNPLTTNYGTRTILIGETKETGVALLHESHAGGSILFGTDGTLLVTTGDNASYSTVDDGSIGHTYYIQALADGIIRPAENVGAFRSQMPTSLCGKVLRLDPDDGDGIPSNPLYDGGSPRSPESRMYGLGLRNPFRMSIEPGSGSTNPADGNPGVLHIADVGWNVWEDLHIFDKPGLNAGWPLYEGLVEHTGYQNTEATNADENGEKFEDNCGQPTSFTDHVDPSQRRFVHDRPEVAWKHGSANEARVPWFTGGTAGGTATSPKIGDPGSPTTGINFDGNTASGGVFIQGDALGSSKNGKYFFSDYARNFINVATLTDGTYNWISDISAIAPEFYGDGIVHLYQNPLDGSVYFTNIFDGTVHRLSFEVPTWTTEPGDMTVECDGTADPGGAYSAWLSSFSGTVGCGSQTLSHNAAGLSTLCGSTGSETVIFTLADGCGNEIVKSATFTIEDTTDPTFNESLPSDATVACDNIPTEATLTAADTCGTASVGFSESTSSGACANEYTITRTWTATDECGNDTIHIQTLNVVDTTDPTFNESLPSDATVACDNIPTEATLTASDTCGTASVGFSESTSAGACDNEYTITRTWTATDECGNDTVHIQTLNVVDTTDPTFNESLPPDTTVACDNIPTEATLTAADTCGTASVGFSESTSAGACDNEYTITRTWTATDECGNDTIHIQTLNVVDTTDPTFNETLPSDATVACDNIPTEATLTAADTCGTASVGFSESTSAGGCANEYTITRTWTATDECGNDTIHIQILNVVDTTDPTFNESLPSDATVACDNIPTEATLTAADTCGTASVGFSESTSAGACDNEYTITRTWTATDECGNDTIHIQTLNVVDTTDPTFNESLPPDTTVACDNIPTEATLTAADTCGTASVGFSESTSAGGCANEYTITRTWTATDACGNDTIHIQTLNVVDTTDPTFNESLPADGTVACDNIPTEATLTAADSCGTASVGFSESTSAGGCANEYTITRTWTATDACGNDTIHIQTLNVVDTTDPTFNETLPSDATVACDNIPTEAILTAADTCGTASVGFSESTSAGACDNEYTITRTWTATDECGNDTIHIQILNVVDTTDPTFNETLPSDATVACDNIPTEATLTASDTCGTASVGFSESTSAGACDNEYTITRTWTATDECGNDTVHIQTLNVVDTTDPTFNESLPPDTTVECDNIPTEATLTAADTCGTASVGFSESTSAGGCANEYTITRTWTATDECGNDTVHIQTLNVVDTTDPTFNESLPPDTTVACDNIPTEATLTAADTCGTASVGFSESTSAGACDNEYTITRTWTATDECGNDTIHIQTLNVVDTTDPTFNETLPSDATVACDNIPTEATLTAADTCGTASVGFSESTTAGGCANEYMITRTWTATDACGNDTIHIQTLNVVDTTDPIWQTPPTDLIVECSASANVEFNAWLGSFSGTDTCGTASISHNGSGSINCGEAEEVTFTLTDACGNFITLSATFRVQDTLGTEEFEEEPVIIYPNPSYDHVIIKGLKSAGVMKLFNMAGQKVLESVVVNDDPVYFNLASGLYMVKIYSENSVINKKLIIE